MLKEARRMAMAWQNGNDRFNACVGSGTDSFLEHNERMRQFRESHDGDLQARVGRLGRTPTYNATNNVMDTVGSRDLINMKAWSVIIPLLKVNGHRFSQN